MSFDIVTKFENRIAEFFGSKYAIAVDSCTHGIELALRYQNEKKITQEKKKFQKNCHFLHLNHRHQKKITI
jgi:dTDP-4-amino-4,6-dideoxygalactose transaminase